jgi:hypothetical protein
VGRLGEDGSYETITQVKQRQQLEKKSEELEKPPAPQEDPKPPADTDPGIDPGSDSVDEFTVEKAGSEVLPNEDAAAEYRAQAAEGVFRRLADALIDQSGVDIDEFAREITDLAQSVAAKESKLNTKKVPDPPVGKPGEFEPLPGVITDPVCTSLFDAGELALRGRKAIAIRQYNQALVMTDAFLGGGPLFSRWLFGQKIEFQQEWRHEGFTLGELVSSFSLLPQEELTMEVSSYQRTRQEIQTEADDTTRRQLAVEQNNTDERSCTNATAADNGWSVSASASVSYPVASASVSAGAHGNSSQQAQQSRRQVTEATTRATTELSSRRAVKVTQTSEAGSESTTTRRLRNPNRCQTVTYNFFQVVKLYDIQLRLVGDRPVLLLPSLFPLFYGPPQVRRAEPLKVRPTEVEIPVYLVEGWRSPAVFLSRYFEVDRELSRQISGWALRLRADIGADPAGAARLWAEALVVAGRYLFRIDPDVELAKLAEFFREYCATILEGRRQSAGAYGPDEGTSVQLNTNGVYVDSLRGRCTACSDTDEANQYVEALAGLEDLRRVRRANELDDQEVERRRKRLEKGELDPFEPAPAVT